MGATDIEPRLVVHGGAGPRKSDGDRDGYIAGVEAALEAGRAALDGGANAAVLAAVEHMEAHTIMNAGRGAALAVDGRAYLDAGFMDGATRRSGGVTGVTRCLHPVRLAERLMADGEYGRLLGPPDVDALAEQLGLALDDPAELVTERARRLWQARQDEHAAAPGPAAHPGWLDTVGAVALDARGHVAAAVSTGGMSLKRRGRIGDSPIVGAGYWADDRVGAVVSTGVGEAILRAGLSRHCCRLIEEGRPPAEAAAVALAEMREHPDDRRGAAGVIVVTTGGGVVLDHSSDEMPGGWITASGARKVASHWRGS